MVEFIPEGLTTLRKEGMRLACRHLGLGISDFPPLVRDFFLKWS